MSLEDTLNKLRALPLHQRVFPEPSKDPDRHLRIEREKGPEHISNVTLTEELFNFFFFLIPTLMHNPFTGNFHNVAFFFHSLIPKDKARSKADMKKQINIAWLVFSSLVLRSRKNYKRETEINNVKE